MRHMELLIALVLLAIIGVLAMAAGTDSRDVDTRRAQPGW
jgi:Tfp pilus assembly protein FimT